MSRKRIGELLLERGAITQAQLDAGLLAQKRTRQRLGITLIQQGLISEIQLAIVLAKSLNLGSVDLTKVQVDWSAVHMLRARFCETHEVFPFAIEGKGTPNKKLLVAMSDPLNQNAIQEIEFTTGVPASIRVATHTHVRQAILRYYHKVGAADATKAAAPPTGAPGSVKVLAAPMPMPPPPPEDEPDVVMGQEIVSEPQKHAQPQRKTGVTHDLDFLFGSAPDEAEAVEKLEKKFWVLLRLLSRKGLISAEEFLKELENDE